MWNKTDMMKSARARIPFILILLLVGNILAQEYEEQNLDISVSSVEKLISVSTPLNLSDLIPYKEYSSTINVSWAIPEDALVGMKGSDDVTIFVSLQANETSFIYFTENGGRTSGTTAVLRCRISNGRCGSGSELNQTVPYILKIDKLGASFRDAIKIRASLMPTSEFSKAIVESQELNISTTELFQKLIKLNISDTDRSKADADLKAVYGSLDSLNVNEARAQLEELNATMEKLIQKSYLLTSIIGIEQELKAKANLTMEEADVASEISDLLVEARASTESMDFGRADLFISLAKNKLLILNSMIYERGRLLPFFSKNLTYMAAFGLALLVLILTFAMKIRNGEKIGFTMFSGFILIVGLLNLEKALGEGTYMVFMVAEILIVAFIISIVLKRKRDDWKKGKLSKGFG